MGIKSLKNLFTKFNVEKTKQIPINTLLSGNRRIAFDTPSLIYQYNRMALENLFRNFQFECSEGSWSIPDDCIIDMFFKNTMIWLVDSILDNNVIPVMVFEGVTPELKIKTCQKRRETSSGIQNATYDDIKEKRDKDLLSLSVSASDVKQLKDKLLKILILPKPEYKYILYEICKEKGIECIQAKYEAEGVASYLASPYAKDLRCDFVFCNDSDVCMYGGMNQFSKLSIKNGVMHVVYVSLPYILQKIRFLPETYDVIDLVRAHQRLLLLLSNIQNDYCPGVKGIASVTLHNLFIKHDIHTYEHLCQIQPKFLDIPYMEIMNTIFDNTRYSTKIE